jgi:hypothetical protein
MGLYRTIFKLPISLPNIQTFSDNYKFLKNNVTGIFAQGYADIPGDFTELRQYLLAKLLWDTTIDIQATTNDFFTRLLRQSCAIYK